jgi:regulator of sigma E protease
MNTLLFFLLTLAVLIVVHEWGHYRVARACGVKVLRFSIGFGRPILRRQRGDTEWVLGLLPLGGYVKMLDEREAPVPAHELEQAFNRKALWQRAAIVAAGPLANLVLAVLLYAASNWIGTDEPRALLSTPVAGSQAEHAGVRAGDRVLRMAVGDEAGWVEVKSLTDLRWQLTRAALDGEDVRLELLRSGGSGQDEVSLRLSALEATDADAALMRRIGIGAPYSEPVLGEIVTGGAAARAGLRPGDRVLSVDGRTVTDAAALRATIRAVADHAARAVAPAVPASEAIEEAAELPPGSQRWHVERAGQTLEIIVRPAIVDDHGQRIGRIEAVVGGRVQMDFVQLGFIDGLQRGVVRTGEMSALTLKMFGRMLMGEASVRNLSGPLTIAEYAGQSAQLGLAYYLGFLAVVSVSLGILNLLPLPMLDGGHLLYYLFEGVMGRPIPDVWIERLQRGGLVVILMMMSLALYNDVARLMGLH